MSRKPFSPKAFEPGATVTWRHFHHGGAETEVAGVVICGAPSVGGNRTMWVQPTTPGFTEVYSMVPVVRVGRERFRFHSWSGNYGSGRKGDFISSGWLGTDTADLMQAAWQHGEHVETARETAAEQREMAA